MRKIEYVYDKTEDKAYINNTQIDKKVMIRLKQELEWEGNTYLIVETRNSFNEFYARGIRKDIYLDSITIKLETN